MGFLQKNTEVFSSRQLLFSLVLMGFSLLIILGSLFYSNRYHRVFLESKPLFNILTPKDRLNFKEQQFVVDVGLYIRDYSVFDILKGEIIFNGSIFFEFDPFEVSLEEVGNFMFAKGVILEKSDPQSKLVDGKIHVRYDIKVSLSTTFKYQRFPLDCHRIDIGLINRSFLIDTLNNIAFVAQHTKFYTNQESVVETPQWVMYHKFVKFGYIGEQFDVYSKKSTLSYPVAYFTLYYVKNGLKNALLIVLPIILMLFIGLFALSLDPKKYKTTSVSIATTALSAIIGYRFIIENISPKVAYFMLSDYLYFIFLLATFIVFLLSFIVDRITVWQKLFCIIFIHVILITLSLYYIGL